MLSKRFIAIVGLGTTLAACGPVNRGLESVNLPVVSRTNYVFDVAAPDYAGLPPQEATRLDAWFRSISLAYGDTVYVDDPQGSGDPSRRLAISSIAGRYGLLVAPGAPVTQGTIPAGSVRVVVARTGASVPDCPNWRRDSQPELEASTMSNYGCALNANMAAMIANPEDLIRGRETGGGTDATAATKALTAYRTAKPTGANGLKLEMTKDGN